MNRDLRNAVLAILYVVGVVLGTWAIAASAAGGSL